MIPRRTTVLAAAGVLLLATGCSQESHVRSYNVAKSPESTTPAPSQPAASREAELVWDTPDGWGTKPPASMRIATFTVPLDGGAEGDCSIIVLSGEGGGLVGNVNRWRGQIGLPEATRSQILEDSMTETGKLGEFQVFRIENPELPDRAFFVSLQPFPGRTAFVKLAAPSASLDSLEPAFLSLCRSLGLPGS